MMFTSRMTHLTAIVLRNRAEAVAEELLRAGVVQFSRLAEVSPSLQARLQSAGVGAERDSLAEVRRRIEGMLKLGGYPLPTAAGSQLAEEPLDVSAIGENLSSLNKDVERYRKRQAELQQEINRIGDVHRQLASMAQLGTGAIPVDLSEASPDGYGPPITQRWIVRSDA